MLRTNLNRNSRINPVEIEKVDVIHTELLERSVQRFPGVFWAADDNSAGVVKVDSKFRSKEDVVSFASPLQPDDAV